MISAGYEHQCNKKLPVRLTHSAPDAIPDRKVHGANIGPTWVLSAPDGPHVGPMDLAISDCILWCGMAIFRSSSQMNQLYILVGFNTVISTSL